MPSPSKKQKRSVLKVATNYFPKNLPYDGPDDNSSNDKPYLPTTSNFTWTPVKSYPGIPKVKTPENLKKSNISPKDKLDQLIIDAQTRKRPNTQKPTTATATRFTVPIQIEETTKNIDVLIDFGAEASFI